MENECGNRVVSMKSVLTVLEKVDQTREEGSAFPLRSGVWPEEVGLCCPGMLQGMLPFSSPTAGVCTSSHWPLLAQCLPGAHAHPSNVPTPLGGMGGCCCISDHYLLYFAVVSMRRPSPTKKAEHLSISQRRDLHWKTYFTGS